MSSLDELRLHYDQRDLSARKWKSRGGTVVGYTCLTTPEEMLYAAGFLPVRIVGSPTEPITLADQYLEDILSPRYRSMLDLYLKGRYDYLDGWFIARQEDSAIRLYYTFKSFREIRPTNIFWLDKVRKRSRRDFKYLVGELGRVRDCLEHEFFLRITDDALAKAIEVYNENRQLLRRVDDLRREDPPRISGEEFFQVTNAGFWMSREEHNRLLKQYLQEVDQRPGHKEGVRIALAGSIIDNLELIKFIEEAGGVVVTDSLLNGTAYFAEDVIVDPKFSPLEALAEHLLYRRPSPHVIPPSDFDDYFIGKVKEANVDGVIFWILRWEDGVGWHYPDQKDMLDELSIPHLLLEMQELHLVAPERLKIRVETFIESLKK